jgi:hypothetical protein
MEMTQRADFPTVLADLVKGVRYKPDWRFTLEELDRGQSSVGLTLVIVITTPDSYHPERTRVVNHYFPVPPAAYDMRSWRRWLFEQVLLVERHEAMEFFQVRDDSLLGLDAPCLRCAHAMTKHDGRNDSCMDCIEQVLPHRYSPMDIVYGRPFAPSHGFGQDPYMVREIGTVEDQKTSFRNELRP